MEFEWDPDKAGENLKKHGAKVLVIEAGKTFVVDHDEMVEKADKYGIIIVARRVESA